MKRLIILPYYPGKQGGYAVAVASDLRRLKITPEDRILIYAPLADRHDSPFEVIPRSSRCSPNRWLNLFRYRTSSEMTASQLKAFLNTKDFDSIFVGDTVMYRATRSIFPNRVLQVRFHNYFSMAYYRQWLNRYSISLQFRINMLMLSRLESEIMRDPLTFPLFITKEEQHYAQLAFPDKETGVWDILDTWPKPWPEITHPSSRRLVFFGSLAHHT